MTLDDLPKPFIIAEVGSNFRGSLDIAKAQIIGASYAGATAVKFQHFTHEELYGYPTTGSRQYELPAKWLPDLAATANDYGLQFMCSAFSPDGILRVDPFVNVHKLASSEFTHVDMWDTLAKINKPTLVSTGGCKQQEIEITTATYAQFICNHVAFMECVAGYPPGDAIHSLDTQCEGMSAHGTPITWVAAASVNYSFFEAHFDVYCGVGGETPDSCVSWSPEIFKGAVESVGKIMSIKSMPKTVKATETEMITKHRRRLKIIRNMQPGDVLEKGVNFGIYRSLTTDAEAAHPSLAGRFEGEEIKSAKRVGDPLWISDVS